MFKFYLIRYFYNALKRFYVNEQGVYAVMTALLAFPLLFLVGFTVDGTGVLLDKARLAQGMEQAALALVAENNSYRKSKTHDDVSRQRVSPAEKLMFNGDEFKAKQDKRNQELIQGIAKVYLRSETKNNSDLPVTVDKPFQYKCEELDLPGVNQYSRNTPVFCQVQGGVNRQFWLPVSESLPNPNSVKNGRLRLESEVAYAIKEKGVVIPVELMLVADFSGSMVWDLNGNENAKYPNRKIDILRSVVSEIQSILFPEKNSPRFNDVSPFNRMGFTTFAGGAKQRGETSSCVMPYYVKQGTLDFTVLASDINRFGYPTCSDRRNNIPFKDGRGRPITVQGCRIQGNGVTALKKTLGKPLLLYSMQLMSDDIIDIKKTIDQVRNFNGSNIANYEIKVNNGALCLGDNSKPTTQAWFDRNKPGISNELNLIEPLGGTAATSGVLVGANILMDSNKDPEAQPVKLGTNTQRILMVLSDGEDNNPGHNTLKNLINGGLCKAIREKVNSLQDKNLRELPTKISFVAFGFNPPDDQKAAWKSCVGSDGYYEVKDQKGLLEAFKQIIGFEEEVGSSLSRPPKF